MVILVILIRGLSLTLHVMNFFSYMDLLSFHKMYKFPAVTAFPRIHPLCRKLDTFTLELSYEILLKRL